jgi:succinoglycan biosynthesis transport protein ExoP
MMMTSSTLPPTPQSLSQASFFTASSVATAGGGYPAYSGRQQSFALGWDLLLKQEKNWILGVLIAGLILVIAYFTLFYQCSYKTEAAIFIKDVPRNAVVADYSTSSLVKTESGYSNPLFNYKQLLESELLASKIYPTLSKKFPEDLKQLKITNLSRFNAVLSKKVISAKIIPSTDIIQIVVKWPNADHAAAVTEDIIKGFKAINLDIQKEVTATQKGHLDSQLAAIAKELSSVRTVVRNFKLNNSAVEITQEGEGLVRVRVDLEQQLESLEGLIRFNRSRVGQLKQLLSVSSPKAAVQASSVGEDPYLVRLQATLSDLQDQRAKLRTKFTDQYPDVKALTDQISQVTADMNKRRKESLGSSSSSGSGAGARGLYDKTSTTLAYDLAKAQAELVSLQAQKAAITQGVANLRSKSLLIPSKELGLKELDSKEQSLLQAYEALRSKQIEANIKNESVIDNLVVLTSPAPGSVDVTGLLLDLVGLMLLVAGLAVSSAWVKDTLTNKWASKEALESITGLPVLSCIPWRSGLISAADAGKFSSKTQNEWFKLAQQLTHLLRKNDAKVIGLFSTDNHRASSSLMDSLAFAFIKIGQVPLVLDPILPPAQQQSVLTQTHFISLGTLEPLIEAVSGLMVSNPLQAEAIITETVAGWQEKLRLAGKENHRFSGLTLAVTDDPDKVMPLLTSQAFNDVLAVLAKQMDCVLVNAPAAETGDAVLMAVAQGVDGALVYVSPQSKRPVLQSMLSDFDKLEAPVLGLLSRCQ